MVTETLLPDDGERHVVLGARLKLELHREARRLIAEWKETLDPQRKSKLATQALLIFDLLDIRVGDDGEWLG